MIEAVVRGYVAGSAGRTIKKTGAICGIPLPAGLKEADKLPADLHALDQGAGRHSRREYSLRRSGTHYRRAACSASTRWCHRAVHRAAVTRGSWHPHCRYQVRVRHGRKRQALLDRRGVDARFFALLACRRISHRHEPPSFDKQYVRDWLEAQKWNKKPPAPTLPDDVAARSAKYREALERLTR